MKVLYLFLDGTRSPGVIRKVKSKIHFLNEAGIETKGIFMNRRIEEYRKDPEEKITYVPLVIRPLPKIFSRRFIRKFNSFFSVRSQRRQFYQRLEEEVSRHSFDLILFRYPLAGKHLLQFVKKYPGKIVFEHNSKEVVEMGLSLQTNPAMKYYIRDEETYGPRVVAGAVGLTAVGKELLDYQLARANNRKIRSTVIPNGLDVRSQQIRTAPAFDGREVRLLFVTGSPSPWVGIDILLRGLADYRGTTFVRVSIVGPVNEAHVSLARELKVDHMVTFTGERTNDELNEFYSNHHLALGTLAMQRVGLSEHSSLKVLEYGARGIPFVISYEETSFSHLSEFAPYFLKTAYDGCKIDIGEIITFANNVLQDKDHPRKMNAVALANFDTSLRMNQLRDFLTDIYNDNRRNG